jgi:hypothetical protein
MAASRLPMPYLPARLWVGGCIAAIVVPAYGCGRGGLHPVSGHVHFADGAPLTTGRVIVDYGDSTQAWGRIQRDGTFTIGTFRENDGMKPGVWKLSIREAERVGGGDPPPPPVPLIHERYASPETSGLAFEVPKQTVWEIVVEKPAKPR